MYKDIGKISKTAMNQLKRIVNNIDRWEIHISDITEHHAVGCMELVKDVKAVNCHNPALKKIKVNFFLFQKVADCSAHNKPLRGKTN